MRPIIIFYLILVSIGANPAFQLDTILDKRADHIQVNLDSVPEPSLSKTKRMIA